MHAISCETVYPFGIYDIQHSKELPRIDIFDYPSGANTTEHIYCDSQVNLAIEAIFYARRYRYSDRHYLTVLSRSVGKPISVQVE